MKKHTENTAQYFSLLFFVLTFLFLADLTHGIEHIAKTNTTISFIHLATGLGLLVTSRLGTETSIYFIRSFGLIYLLISLIGFQGFQGSAIQTDSQWPYVLYLNLINYIHFILGVILSFSGTTLNNRNCQGAIAQNNLITKGFN